MSNALIKHFNISDTELSEIQKNLQQNQTLLDALFERNLLDSSAYLAWAKEHYSLPVLKAAFLEKNDNVAALLGRYKNVFPRNVIPFHEMDGVLYVMCLEPTPFEAPQTIQYVLAPYEVITKYAVKNEATATTTPSEVEPEALLVKENTNPLFKNLETSPSAPEPQGLEGLSFDNISIGDSTDGPQLEGLNLSSQEEQQLSAPAPEGELPEISLEAKKDVPAGLAFPENPEDESSIITDKPVNSVDLNSFKFEGIAPASEPSAPASPSEPTPEVQVQAPDPKTAPAPAAPTPQPKAAPAATTKTSTSSLDDFVVKPKAKPAQAAQAQPAAAPTAVTATAATPDNKFGRTLESLKKYFQQAMVLQFNDGTLEPIAWDETWSKVAHSQAAIDITTPSIFRIVNESQDSYHGYIVPNPVNDAFFNTWNKGQTPEHITICPILMDKKVCGMVLGVTTQEGAKKYQLHHIQQIANEAAVQISATKAA